MCTGVVRSPASSGAVLAWIRGSGSRRSVHQLICATCHCAALKADDLCHVDGPAVVSPPQITYTIAKTYQPLRPGSVLSFQNAALGSVGE